MNVLEKIKNSRRFILLAKTALSVCIFFIIGSSLFINGLKPYYSYKDYSYQKDFLGEYAFSLERLSSVSQRFVAKGNILDSISVYIGEMPDEGIRISIYQTEGSEIASKYIAPEEVTGNAWNKLPGFKIHGLKRNEEYTVEFSGDKGLKPLVLSTGNAPIIFGACSADGQELEGTLALGFQFIYNYLTLGSLFELSLSILSALIAGFALCWTIFRLGDLMSAFTSAEKKKGFAAAFYFSVSLVLLYNPLETIRTKVSDFSRVMGAGLMANVDVSKRTGNFNHWFLFFIVCFVLFWFLFHHLFQNAKGYENEKVIAFLDHLFVVANCNLALRCITYFNDESAITTVYYFSSAALMAVAFIAIGYLVLGLEKHLSAGCYARLHFIGAVISLPLAIITSLEWGKGRVLLGWWVIIAVAVIIYCKYRVNKSAEDRISCAVGTISMLAALIPLLTSLYIEMIHVMNQYEVYVAYPGQYYGAYMALYVIVTAVCVFLVKNNGFEIGRLKHWVMPLFVFGISCLSIQIPLSITCNPDVFEGANYSILISDFLNFGRIPIVEHYGGHMMTQVWEGILYGVINSDYFGGAAAAPYSMMVLPFLVMFFYFLVKEMWDEDIAPVAALFFPFYQFWSLYGLGMLVCLAAMAFVRKNTYTRAALTWAAFVWCVIYRLDLGFAFGIAIIFSLCTYVVATKNRLALKQLGITFGIWGGVGMFVWCVLCLIKSLNPINRLIEFCMISLSNQNWAYTGIGNRANSVFGWSYIIIPFMVILGLLYTTFSKQLREKFGIARWMLLLLFGWSYLGNFSRGLVRHSLAEASTAIAIWSGYLFLALFVSMYKGVRKLFLPTFMLFMLCDTLFAQDENFTHSPIAESAVEMPSSIIESWKPGRFSAEEHEEAKLRQKQVLATGTAVNDEDLLPEHYMTLWEQIKYDGKKVERVELNADLERYTNKYRKLLSVLLEDDETFVDFINKTLLFSLLNRENPVYVSQSPLQLSGEFTQKEFVKEIAGIPIVLMPIDADNYRASNSLDGLANVYRNYKAAEYIYQNYRPLCQYGKDYAVWCLKDRVKDYRIKLETLAESRNYAGSLARSETIECENVELSPGAGGYAVLKSTGTDPMITGLQTVIDTSEYKDGDMQICIAYSTDTDGTMQLFYTTEQGENYTENKVVTENISGTGTASFTVPITEYSSLRLDIPEGSRVEIRTLAAKLPVNIIDYGYDGPNVAADSAENTTYSYISALHYYSIGQLPRIWAEGDKKRAAENPVAAELTRDGSLFTFDPSSVEKNTGNYLLISASYDGADADGLYYDDDEQIGAMVIMGKYTDGVFEEKCRYTFSIKEGSRDYLIRCSTDYYWYLNEINAVGIYSDGVLYHVAMKILEGD